MMSKDLFLALLSMDVYNRGYGAGLVVPEAPALGNAAIQVSSSDIFKDGSDKAAGCYAVAYETTQNIGTTETGGVIPEGTTLIPA